MGDGELSKRFEILSNERVEFDFLGRLESGDLPRKVSENVYGILPLPDALEWNLGSPLKVMEFAASGLKCLTTDVDGTSPFEGQPWICRADKADPVESWFATIIDDQRNPEKVSSERIAARAYAEKNLTWESALKGLVKYIQE